MSISKLITEGRAILEASGWEAVLSAYVKDPSPYNKAELSDYGVNTLREAGAARGYSQAELSAIVREEMRRMRKAHLSADAAGLKKYMKLKRVGSEYPINRKMRVGLFLVAVARGL